MATEELLGSDPVPADSMDTDSHDPDSPIQRKRPSRLRFLNIPCLVTLVVIAVILLVYVIFHGLPGSGPHSLQPLSTPTPLLQPLPPQPLPSTAQLSPPPPSLSSASASP